MNKNSLITIAILLLIFSGVLLGYIIGNSMQNHKEYIIQFGDTCAKIAYEHRISVIDLIQANESLKAQKCMDIYIGQKLRIPNQSLPSIEQLNKVGIDKCKKAAYTTGAGDEPYQVALKFNTTIEIIEELNNLKNTSYYLLDEVIVPICNTP
jgi:LysM repeat protein